MEALVLEADRQLQFYPDHPIPEAPAKAPGPCALVRVAACGICGSDIGRGFGGKAYHYPLIMGHEFSGVIEEPAPGGELAAGTPVAIFPLLPCYKCAPCQTGNYAQCEDYDYYGSRRHGAFGEFLRIPEANLFRIPPHVDLKHASMTEPAAVALHGVRMLSVNPGDSAVVFGAGPIGNMTAQWLRIAGAQRVFVVDIDERKLALAGEMGFEPVHGGQVDPVAHINEQTGGGVQRAIEAVGLPKTFLQTIQCAARAGEVVFMGNIAGTFEIGEKDFSSILRKELTIHGTWNSMITPCGTDDWSTVLKYMDRELQVAPLITDRLSLQDGPAIFDDLLNHRGFHNKVLFDISH